MMNFSFIKGHRDIISLAIIQRTKSLRPTEKKLTYSNVIEKFLGKNLTCHNKKLALPSMKGN